LSIARAVKDIAPGDNLNHWPQKLELTSLVFLLSISGVGIPDNTNHG